MSDVCGSADRLSFVLVGYPPVRGAGPLIEGCHVDGARLDMILMQTEQDARAVSKAMVDTLVGGPTVLDREFGSEGHTTLGIDFIPLGSAPGGELVRVNYCLNGDPAAALDLLEKVFGPRQPGVVVPGEYIGILKDSE